MDNRAQSETHHSPKEEESVDHNINNDNRNNNSTAVNNQKGDQTENDSAAWSNSSD